MTSRQNNAIIRHLAELGRENHKTFHGSSDMKHEEVQHLLYQDHLSTQQTRQRKSKLGPTTTMGNASSATTLVHHHQSYDSPHPS